MQEIITQLNPVALNIIATIVVIFLLTVITNVLVISIYNGIRRSFTKSNEKGETNYRHDILNKVSDDFVAAFKRNDEVNTQAIIENNFYRSYKPLIVGERFSKNAVSLMITLGLLGTFYGLTISIAELVELLSQASNVESIENVISGLMSSINGMSVAFVTSLFGIIGSIIITIINIFFNISQSKEDMFIEIENFLDNELSQKMSTKELTPDGVTKGVGSKSVTYDPNNMGKSLDRVATGLLMTIEKFEVAIDKFTDNTADFSQFNHELRTNIERMNVTLGDFITDLKGNKK